MEFTQAIAARYSCRNFLDTPVDAETIGYLVEMAQRSPSWGNTQPWRVWAAGGEVAASIRQELVERGQSGAPPVPDIPMPVAFEGAMKARYIEVGKSVFAVLGIEREDEEKRSAHRTNNCNAFGAPALVYLTLPEGLTPYAMLDAGAFLTTFCLAAADRGLATCIQATLAHYPDIIRQHLPVPVEERIVVGVSLGYADAACDINRFRSAREPVEKILTLTGF